LRNSEWVCLPLFELISSAIRCLVVKAPHE
jgi:hypothetical protein